jgi:hypothetical protein
MKSPTFQNLIHTEFNAPHLSGEVPDMFQNTYADLDSDDHHFVSVVMDERVPGKISKIK